MKPISGLIGAHEPEALHQMTSNYAQFNIFGDPLELSLIFGGV